MSDDESKPKPRHVQRPCPPWREPTITECGRKLDGSALSRDEFTSIVLRLGKQRASMQLCMTCWTTACRWSDWATDPVAVISRDTHGMRMHPTGDHFPNFRDELRALAALVDAHRDEFDGFLSGLGDTASLDAARSRRRRVEGQR